MVNLCLPSKTNLGVSKQINCPVLYRTDRTDNKTKATLKYADRILKSLDINNGVFVMHLSFLAYTQNMYIQTYDMV
jgi:hypothetical protein